MTYLHSVEKKTHKYYLQEESARLHFCDVCEKLVGSAAEYKQHVSEHATCGIDGCGYTAHQVRGKYFN